MPNWCNNDVTLSHQDPEVIARAVKAYQLGKFLQEFIPIPEDVVETDGWYHWCINNWGTKWDIGGDGEFIEQPDATTLVLKFDSAWSPPIEAYHALEEQGFEVAAYFNEPGMAFCGTYDAEYGESTIDYSSMSADQIRDELPELDERFCISQWIEDSQEEIGS